MNRIKNLVGKKFNRLLVLAEENVGWRCLCDCGTECVVSGGNLKSGHKKSCGCLYSPNLTGKKFEKLTVINKAYSKFRRWYWECQCDCGNITIVDGVHLNSGHTKSCGCNSHHRNSKNKQWLGHGEISGSIWSEITRNAKSRNLKIDISIKDAWEIFEQQNGKCALTGLELVFPKTEKELKIGVKTASLDRINSDLGYIRENVWWIHKNLNFIKNDMPLDNFLYWCDLISNKDNSEFELIVPTIKKKANWKGCGLLNGQYLSVIRLGAIARSMTFDITAKIAWEKFLEQGGRCAISNTPLRFSLHHQNKDKIQTASLDRINSDIGYIVGNIQWVHKVINRMKWDFTDDYFVSICRKVNNWYGKQ